MNTLEFKNSLVNSRFAYYNEFNYVDLVPLGMYIKDTDKEAPYIALGNNVLLGYYHKTEGGITEIHYSAYPNQLNSRLLTLAKVKDIVDGARVPIIVKVGGMNFLMGKGFIAHRPSRGTHTLLFVATYPTGLKGSLTMQDIKFYINRLVFSDLYKKIQPFIKEMMSKHVGDVIVTDYIDKYVGGSIDIPNFRNITDRKNYIDNLIDYCVDIVSEKVDKISKPKPIITEIQKKVKVKKEKEAETMKSILTTTSAPIGGLDLDSSEREEMKIKAAEIVAALEVKYPEKEEEEKEYDDEVDWDDDTDPIFTEDEKRVS